MKTVFLDSGILIGLANKRDLYHEKSKDLLEEYSKNHQLVTSDFVLDETIAHLSRILGRKKAVQFSRAILSSSLYRVCYVDAELLAKAVDFLEKYSDQAISCTDATSMAFVRTQRISKILTFDSEFRYAGFPVVP